MIIHKQSFVVDDETGATFWPTNAGAAFDAGNARFRVAGVDLSVYASADNRYKLVAKDTALLKAEGWIDLADSAEALGSELSTDGGFAAITKATAKGIDGITSADPGVVTFDPGHGYVNGDVIYFSGLNEMTELNTKYFKLRSNSGDTFELSDAAIGTWDSSSLDTTGYAAETTGGNCAQKCDFTSWTEGTGWHPGVDGAGALTGTADCDGEQGGNSYLYQSTGLTVNSLGKHIFTIANYTSGELIGYLGNTVGVRTTYSENVTDTSYDIPDINGNCAFEANSTFIGSIDAVSVKEVTHVGEDGVLIMSTKGGATQSWALQESGIDLNDIASFEVQRATRHHSM